MIATVHRYCFQLHVAAEHIEEYRRRHAAVWPDMLRALEASGRTNYSLFLREDGLVTGYFEHSEPIELVRAAMDSSPVNERWQSSMRGLLVDAAQSPIVLEEVFHLEGDPGPSAGSGR